MLVRFVSLLLRFHDSPALIYTHTHTYWQAHAGGNTGALTSSATQALVTGFSIFVGGIAGALTGLLAKFTGRIALGGSYSDHVFWIVPDDFTHIGEEGADVKAM